MGGKTRDYYCLTQAAEDAAFAFQLRQVKDYGSVERGGERESISSLSQPQINHLVVSRHLRVLLANSEFSNLAPMIAGLLFSIVVLISQKTEAGMDVRW